jgi:hypothetical protein
MDIFEHPDRHLGRLESEDLVMEYLESDAISDIPFRKVANRYPDNFKKVVEYLGRQEGFETVEIDDLMREFKPHSFNKLPTTVVTLDSEMTRLAKLTDKNSESDPGRLKNFSKK